MNLLVLILIPWAVLAALMSMLWLYQRKTHNAGIVDVAWSFGTAITAIWFAWFLGGFILFAWAVFYYTKDWPSGVAIDWIRKWLRPFWEIYNFW